MTEVYYEYYKGWHSRKINSHYFHESWHKNPDNEWPFHGDTFRASRLDMENMKLDLHRALSKLGNSNRHIDLNSFEEIACYETEGKFKHRGFKKLHHRGEYLYTSVKKFKDNSTSSSSSSSSSSSDEEKEHKIIKEKKKKDKKHKKDKHHKKEKTRIGDMRIGFNYSPCGMASVMA